MPTKTLFPLLLLLTSCYSQNVSRDSYLDANNKTIVMPRGNSGVLGSMKSILKEEGWDTRVATGSVSEKTGDRTVTHINHNAKYLLWYKADYVDLEFPTFSPMYNVSVGIVENKTGVENINLEARRYTVSRFGKLFRKTLRENTK